MLLLLSAALLGQCPVNQFPRGVAFDFVNAVETVNNLGGIPGGPGLDCLQNPNQGGPLTSCGAGCACTPASAASVAPPGTPQELRFAHAGAVFDGLGGSRIFDLVLTNQSAYTPWESDKNGRQTAVGQSGSFAGVSMFSDTEVDFRINFYDPGTFNPFVVNDDFVLCFYDMDAGVPLIVDDFNGPKSLVETLTICGWENYIHQGRVSVTDPSPAFATQLVLDAMCPNIDVSAYLDINEFPNPNNPLETCISVVGLQSGRGSDNPSVRESVILDTCSTYDTCPGDGLSGVDRAQTGDDSFTCAPGSTVATAGEYPAGQEEVGLRNQPFRWTVTKFICLQYSGGRDQLDFTYKVSRSRDGQLGRNFMIAGFAVDTPCINVPSPPPLPPPPSPLPSATCA